jgi:hypothetical protein
MVACLSLFLNFGTFGMPPKEAKAYKGLFINSKILKNIAKILDTYSVDPFQ